MGTESKASAGIVAASGSVAKAAAELLQARAPALSVGEEKGLLITVSKATASWTSRG
jgi:hypothetical protein